MDIDLSTNLDSFVPMITPLIMGEAAVATGSRLMKQSHTTRGFKRDTISRCYNWIIRRTMKTKFVDAQCGFKAIRRDAAREILPRIKDTGWFFDTELLVKAEYAGYTIHEEPVFGSGSLLFLQLTQSLLVAHCQASAKRLMIKR